jgi:hypothetical protein
VDCCPSLFKLSVHSSIHIYHHSSQNKSHQETTEWGKKRNPNKYDVGSPDPGLGKARKYVIFTG